MTNRSKLFFIFALVMIGIIWSMQKMKQKSLTLAKQKNTISKDALPPSASVKPFIMDGRKVISNSAVVDKNRHPSNIISPEWKENFEKIILMQSGGRAKDIVVTKIDSFIWTDSGQTLNVESVLVSLKNDKNESTKFNALVDSQSGKIIQTWNQPVKDPGNPRDSFGVKLDPRYNE